jgi:hypothetical protein
LRKSLLNSSCVSVFRLCVSPKLSMVVPAHLSGGALGVTSWFSNDVGGMFCEFACWAACNWWIPRTSSSRFVLNLSGFSSRQCSAYALACHR